jgi:hypothetical protein
MATRIRRAPTPEEMQAGLDPDEWGTPIPGTGGLISTDPAPEIPEPETPLDRIASFLGASVNDQRAEVRVFRLKDGHSHRLDWCKNYSAADFEAGGDLEMIRREWGPGDYQLRLYGTRAGAFGMLTKEDIGLVADPRATAPPTMQAQQQNSELAMMLKSMAENQAAMMRALAERPDPMAQMAPMLTLLGQMKNVFGPSESTQAPKSQLSDIVAAIRELREVSSEINPPPPEPDSSGGLIPMAGQVMELVRMGMENRQQQPQLPGIPPIITPPAIAFPPIQPPIQRATNPAGVQVTQPAQQSPTPQPVPNQETLDMGVAELKRQLAEVIAMAAAGQPAEIGADVLYEKLPDEAIDLLLHASWFDLLCQFEPACKPHEAWFREAHAMVLQMLEEDATQDADDESRARASLIPKSEQAPAQTPAQAPGQAPTVLPDPPQG